MNILDSHQHFWNYDPIRHAWIDESMAKIRKDFLPEDLNQIYHANGVGGCIAVQADQSLEETNFLLDLASRNSYIKGVVGWVDLRSQLLEAQLDNYSRYKLLKGVRHIVQAEAEGFMLNQSFVKGVSMLGKYNLVYDLLIYPNQLKESISFVQLHSGLPIVLDHLAKPYIKSGLLETWARDIKALARYDNVYCKISGMVTEAEWFTWKKADFHPYLDVVLEAFGAHRVMFGSDWPVCLLAGEYKDVLEIVRAYTDRLSEDERHKIWYENAVKFYNIEPD